MQVAITYLLSHQANLQTQRHEYALWFEKAHKPKQGAGKIHVFKV